MAKNYDDIGGVWRTVGGRHIFIKDGQDLASAMKESGKFKKQKITTDSEEQKRSELNQKLKEAQEKVDKLDEELAEYEEDEMMAGSPAHDELRWKYEDAKEEYYKIKNELRQLQNKDAYTNNEDKRPIPDERGGRIDPRTGERFFGKTKAEEEYELYKRARQDESSIDPMTENSTDWEALDEKYKDRYEKEQSGYKTYLKDTQGTNNEELINAGREKENRVDYQKYKNETIRTINKYRMEKGTTSLNQAYKKAFEEYKRLHPNTKLNLQEFIKMSEE